MLARKAYLPHFRPLNVRRKIPNELRWQAPHRAVLGHTSTDIYLWRSTAALLLNNFACSPTPREFLGMFLLCPDQRSAIDQEREYAEYLNEYLCRVLTDKLGYDQPELKIVVRKANKFYQFAVLLDVDEPVSCFYPVPVSLARPLVQQTLLSFAERNPLSQGRLWTFSEQVQQEFQDFFNEARADYRHLSQLPERECPARLPVSVVNRIAQIADRYRFDQCLPLAVIDYRRKPEIRALPLFRFNYPEHALGRQALVPFGTNRALVCHFSHGEQSASDTYLKYNSFVTYPDEGMEMWHTAWRGSTLFTNAGKGLREGYARQLTTELTAAIRLRKLLALTR